MSSDHRCLYCGSEDECLKDCPTKVPSQKKIILDREECKNCGLMRSTCESLLTYKHPPRRCCQYCSHKVMKPITTQPKTHEEIAKEILEEVSLGQQQYDALGQAITEALDNLAREKEVEIQKLKHLIGKMVHIDELTARNREIISLKEQLSIAVDALEGLLKVYSNTHVIKEKLPYWEAAKEALLKLRKEG